MPAPISPIQLADPASIIQPLVNSASSSQSGGAIFHSMFNAAVNTVDNFQSEATKSVEDLLSGASEDVHKPIIATEKADLTFQLFLQVRNKVVSAYQSIMGMQL